MVKKKEKVTLEYGKDGYREWYEGFVVTQEGSSAYLVIQKNGLKTPWCPYLLSGVKNGKLPKNPQISLLRKSEEPGRFTFISDYKLGRVIKETEEVLGVSITLK